MSAVCAGRANRRASRRGRLSGILWLGLALAALPQVAQAQPFGAWLTLTGDPTNGYVSIPHSSALNPTSAFTLEAWVAISNSPAAEDCRSIAGNNFKQAWWLGQCTVGGQPVLRSYLKGLGSSKQGGIIPRGVWTHVAVVFNGTHRLHYINGELAAQFAETGPLTTSNPDQEVRIGSDEEWNHSPTGAIDEVRLWNVARTMAQLRANLNKRIAVAQPGLVAVWALDNTQDVIGPHDGMLGGSGRGFLNFPVALNCGATTASVMCLNTRFAVRAYWRTNPTPGTPPDGNAQVVGSGPDSGVFWFFSPNNWEVMVKVLNACSLNSRYWVFSAATTNVFYRMEVTDSLGAQKIYFNYPGPPAPAVTDVDALATCP